MYTEEMYNEDKSIACWLFNRSYKKYSLHKSDWIQECLLQLYKVRHRFDERKGTYFNFASKVCERVFLCQIKDLCKQTNCYSLLSLDKESNSIEYSSMYDTVSTENTEFEEMQSKIDYEILLNFANNVIDDCKSNTIKKYIKPYINGQSSTQIRKQYNITRQMFEQTLKKFQKIAQEEYDKQKELL